MSLKVSALFSAIFQLVYALLSPALFVPIIVTIIMLSISIHFLTYRPLVTRNEQKSKFPQRKRRSLSLASSCFFEPIKEYSHLATPSSYTLQQPIYNDFQGPIPSQEKGQHIPSLSPSRLSSIFKKPPEQLGSFPYQVVSTMFYFDKLPTLSSIFTVLRTRMLHFTRLRSIPVLEHTYLTRQWVFEELSIEEIDISNHIFFHSCENDFYLHRLLTQIKECDLYNNPTLTPAQEPYFCNNNNIFIQPLFELHIILNKSSSTTSLSHYDTSLLSESHINPYVQSPKPFLEPKLKEHRELLQKDFNSPGGKASHAIILRAHHSLADGSAIAGLLCQITTTTTTAQQSVEGRITNDNVGPNHNPSLTSSFHRMNDEDDDSNGLITVVNPNYHKLPYVNFIPPNLNQTPTTFPPSNQVDHPHQSLLSHQPHNLHHYQQSYQNSSLCSTDTHSASNSKHTYKCLKATTSQNIHIHKYRSLVQKTQRSSQIPSFYYTPAALFQRQYQERFPGRFRVIPLLKQDYTPSMHTTTTVAMNYTEFNAVTIEGLSKKKNAHSDKNQNNHSSTNTSTNASTNTITNTSTSTNNLPNSFKVTSTSFQSLLDPKSRLPCTSNINKLVHKTKHFDINKALTKPREPRSTSQSALPSTSSLITALHSDASTNNQLGDGINDSKTNHLASILETNSLYNHNRSSPSLLPQSTHQSDKKRFFTTINTKIRKITQMIKQKVLFLKMLVMCIIYYIYGAVIMLLKPCDDFSIFSPPFISISTTTTTTTTSIPHSSSSTSIPSSTQHPSNTISYTPLPSVTSIDESRAWVSTSEIINIKPFPLQILQQIKINVNVHQSCSHIISTLQNQPLLINSALNNPTDTVCIDPTSAINLHNAKIHITSSSPPQSIPSPQGALKSFKVIPNSTNTPLPPIVHLKKATKSESKAEPPSTSSVTINDVALGLISGGIKRYMFICHFCHYILQHYHHTPHLVTQSLLDHSIHLAQHYYNLHFCPFDGKDTLDDKDDHQNCPQNQPTSSSSDACNLQNYIPSVPVDANQNRHCNGKNGKNWFKQSQSTRVTSTGVHHNEESKHENETPEILSLQSMSKALPIPLTTGSILNTNTNTNMNTNTSTSTNTNTNTNTTNSLELPFFDNLGDASNGLYPSTLPSPHRQNHHNSTSPSNYHTKSQDRQQSEKQSRNSYKTSPMPKMQFTTSYSSNSKSNHQPNPTHINDFNYNNHQTQPLILASCPIEFEKNINGKSTDDATTLMVQKQWYKTTHYPSEPFSYPHYPQIDSTILNAIHKTISSIQLRSLITVALPRKPNRLLRNVTSNSNSIDGISYEMLQLILESARRGLLTPYIPCGAQIYYVYHNDLPSTMTPSATKFIPDQPSNELSAANNNVDAFSQGIDILSLNCNHGGNFNSTDIRNSVQCVSSLDSFDSSYTTNPANNSRPNDMSLHTTPQGFKTILIDDYEYILYDEMDVALNKWLDNEPYVIIYKKTNKSIMISEELLFIVEFYPYFTQVMSNKSSSGFIALLEPEYVKSSNNQQTTNSSFQHAFHRSSNDKYTKQTANITTVDTIIPIHHRTQHLKLFYEYILSALLTYVSIQLSQLHIPLISPLLSPIGYIIRSLSSRSMNHHSLLISNVPGPTKAHLCGQRIQAMVGSYIGQAIPFVTIVTINHAVFLTFTQQNNQLFLQSIYNPASNHKNDHVATQSDLNYLHTETKINTTTKTLSTRSLETRSHEYVRAVDLVCTMLSPQYLFNRCFYDELHTLMKIYGVSQLSSSLPSSSSTK